MIIDPQDVCSEILQGFVEQLEMEVEGQLPTEGELLSLELFACTATIYNLLN